jgi:glucose/arabinose dehydrogenase
MKVLPGLKGALQVSLAAMLGFYAVCTEVSCQTKTASKPPAVVEMAAPKQFEIKPADMPKPYASESAMRPSRVIAQPDNATLSVPKGFKVNVFAEGDFQQPRWMVLAPNGDVFLSDGSAGKIIVLRDTNKDGTAEERFTFAENLDRPFGMAFFKEWFYVAQTDSIMRYKYTPGRRREKDLAVSYGKS